MADVESLKIKSQKYLVHKIRVINTAINGVSVNLKDIEDSEVAKEVIDELKEERAIVKYLLNKL